MRSARNHLIAPSEGPRRSSFRHLLRVAVATAATVALTGAVTVGSPAAADAIEAAAPPTDITATVTSDPLPTTQIDGIVWTQKIVGQRVYAGGKFSNARPAGAAAGTNLTSRNNLLRYDLITGVLDASWNPNVNSDVLDVDVSPDGSRIYVVGKFTTVGGQSRNRAAAFDASTGALISTWKPDVNGEIDTVAATADTVYLGGQFSGVNGTQRTRVAAVSASTGSTLPFTASLSGGYGVKGLEISPDRTKVVIAGSFESVNGSTNPGRGLAALDAKTGALLPWQMNSLIRNAGTKAAIIALNSDADGVYGVGYDYGGTSQDGFEGAFRANWSDGSLVWMEDCHGDSYAVAPVVDSVYVASHSHYCGNIGGFPQTNPWGFHHSLSFSKNATGPAIAPDPMGYRSFAGQPSPTLQHWFPDWTVGTVAGQAVWTVTGNADYVVYGGEFPKVNGAAQQGLVRFARPGIAPSKIGPRVQGGAWALNASSARAGEVRLSWQANHDPDDRTLHYEIRRRDKGSTPIWKKDQDSTFWDRPTMTFRDPTVTAGQSYQYMVRVTDGSGNTTNTDWTTVTASNATLSSYANAVIDDGAADYWRLSDTGTSTSIDWAGTDDLAMSGGISRGADGAIMGDSDKATTFDGNAALGATPVQRQAPDTFGVEAWFKTTSTAGGKILGYGSNNTGNSSHYDRHVYMDELGRVNFGVYTGSTRVISSAPGLNDGKWHHVVANMSSAGMEFIVDGHRVGRITSVTAGENYAGYWRVGGDSTWAGANYFAGTIDDVAVYPAPLTLEKANGHWTKAGRTSTTTPAPADAYGARVYEDDPELYWRLGESGGTTAADSGPTGSVGGTYSGGGIAFGQNGAVKGTSDKAVAFDGSTGELGSAASVDNPTTYSLETWFKTDTTVGGKLIGFGSSPNGNSGSYDRHVYMQDDGRLVFGVWTGQANTIVTRDPLNDNAWHHVVATQGGDGMKLYVDGRLVDTNPQTQAQEYSGYWRVGNDTTWGSSSSHFNGTLDEVAVYSSVLSAATVSDHHQLGSGSVANQPPVAAFASSSKDLALSVDGSSSSDPDGTVASYAWDFGDGGSASGVTASHTYGSAGNYTVKLTVTDDKGATNSVIKQVAVTAANQPPLAEFTSSSKNLALSVDGSDSSDPDGTVASYAWDFGDGGLASGVTASHTYGSAGTYAVKLTITDNKGATTTATKQVTVTAANQPPVAAFTSSSKDLALSVDGSDSSDPDGTVASYAWDFGDGGSASGVTASHTYGSAGTYAVKLTVTDNKGATNTATKQVSVTATTRVLAQDLFDRSVAGGWGSATVGGPWTVQGGNTAFSVAESAGVVSMKKGDTRTARLSAVTTDSVDILAEVSSDRTGLGLSWTLIGRQVGSDQYAARVKFEANGLVRLYILKNESALGGTSYVLPSAAYAPGDRLSIKLHVAGTSPTSVAAKIWRSGTDEPAGWQIAATDTTASLQQAGSIGLMQYLSTSSATDTATTRLLTYVVTRPGA